MKYLPPGPKGLPIIGNMMDMADTDRMIKVSKEWADEYGEIFYTKVGLSHFVWLSSATAVRDLMDKRGSIYSSRAASPMINMVSNEERVNFLPYGDKWRTIRNILHSALNLETSTIYKPVQDFESKQAVWEILNAKDDMEFNDINRRYSTSTIMTITYGHRVKDLNDPLYQDILKIVRHFSLATAPGAWMIDTLPMLANIIPQSWLQNWKDVARQWYKEDSEIYLKMYGKLMDQVKNGTAPDCFLKDLAREKLEKNPIPDVTAAFAAGALIEAGSDATTTALNNVILACLLYPEVVKGAHEELDRVVGSDRMPDFSDEPNLPYIRGIAKETLRWRASTKIGTCHSTTQDDWYKGYFIPKGAVIVLNWWYVVLSFNFPRANSEQSSMSDNTNVTGLCTWMRNAGKTLRDLIPAGISTIISQRPNPWHSRMLNSATISPSEQADVTAPEFTLLITPSSSTLPASSGPSIYRSRLIRMEPF